jgi:Iron-containing redox enzyme
MTTLHLIDTNARSSDSITCDAEELLAYMDAHVNQIASSTEASAFWETLTSKETDVTVIRTVLREILLEVFFYNAPIVETGMALIGLMPRNMALRKVKAMLRHLAEEFDHGEMALEDYVALGGDEVHARSRRMSPAALAAAGIWRMLLNLREPFAYVGGMYLFETLTPIVCERLQAALAGRELGRSGLGFIEFHSAEDPKHATLMRVLIEETAAQFPESVDAMRYGFDCFRAVYPAPVWEGAYRRALQSV